MFLFLFLQIQYKVKWEDYPTCSWVRSENLSCDELLEEYEQSIKAIRVVGCRFKPGDGLVFLVEFEKIPKFKELGYENVLNKWPELLLIFLESCMVWVFEGRVHFVDEGLVFPTSLEPTQAIGPPIKIHCEFSFLRVLI